VIYKYESYNFQGLDEKNGIVKQFGDKRLRGTYIRHTHQN